MGDFQIDARRWRFLDNPAKVHSSAKTGGLKIEPLARQFQDGKGGSSHCLADGRGVLLADDVGLGKTTVSALVAWVVACQDKRVRSYAPNEVLRRHWAEELERHVPMLEQIGASKDPHPTGRRRAAAFGEHPGRDPSRARQEHGNSEQRTACDLMIIDEAHRAKGDGSAFTRRFATSAIARRGSSSSPPHPSASGSQSWSSSYSSRARRTLEAVRRYANDLKRLYALGDGHDVAAESKRLVSAAKAAIEELQPYPRSPRDRRPVGGGRAAALRSDHDPVGSHDASGDARDLQLLLRMDRLLQLAPERMGERRNDPRFHIGWQHVGTELERAEARVRTDADPIVGRHVNEAKASLKSRRRNPHPKIAAVSEAIRPRIDAGEKVLVFCHHRATASELLSVLERALKTERVPNGVPPATVWRTAWGVVAAE